MRTAATFPKKRIFIEDIQTLLDIEVFQKKPKTKKDYAQSLIKSFERDLIVKQLNIHLGNQRRAAEALGMPTSTLHDKIKSYKISSPKTKKSQLRVVS